MKNTPRYWIRFFIEALTTGLFIALIWLFAGSIFTGRAQQEPPSRTLIAIGGGYPDIYPGFVEAAMKNSRDGVVNILILPVPFASDPQNISVDQRRELLQAAENRRFQVEEACNRSAPESITCSVALAPILVRADATNPENLQYFAANLSAVLILGGDQSIAMQVIGGTPLEQALFQAYDQGAIIAGTNAGGNMLSPAMIAGYQSGYTASNSLDFGAVNVWNTSEQHGLVFGLQGAVLDTHFNQFGRLGRLLNAISLPESPQLGIGVDAYTGFQSPHGTGLENLFGLYNVTVLDALTYHSAHAVQYRGPGHTLSLRNVLVHILTPGNFSYDLETRAFTQFGRSGKPLQPPLKAARTFESLQIPTDAGVLFLAGDLSSDLENNAVLERFVQLSGGDASQILVYADGYPSALAAEMAANEFSQALGGNGLVVFIDP